MLAFPIVQTRKVRLLGDSQSGHTHGVFDSPTVKAEQPGALVQY